MSADCPLDCVLDCEVASEELDCEDGLFACAGLSGLDGPVTSVLLDAMASLAGAILAVLLMTRDELVRIPQSAGLTEIQASVFADLLFRVVFVVCLVAAILLVMRFARRLLRVKQLLGR